MNDPMQPTPSLAYTSTRAPGVLAAYSKEEAERLIAFLGLDGWVPLAVGAALVGWQFSRALVIVGRSVKSQAEAEANHEWVAQLRMRLAPDGELRLA